MWVVQMTTAASKRIGRPMDTGQRLRDQLGRIDRLRVRLIDNQPATAADLMLLIDRARDRRAKARLRTARAG